jgi:hypothetical protein
MSLFSSFFAGSGVLGGDLVTALVMVKQYDKNMKKYDKNI